MPKKPRVSYRGNRRKRVAALAAIAAAGQGAGISASLNDAPSAAQVTLIAVASLASGLVIYFIEPPPASASPSRGLLVKQFFRFDRSGGLGVLASPLLTRTCQFMSLH
jgi:hypothetical protein